MIAVAVKEFEAWLLSDEGVLRELLSCEVPTIAAPEDLARGEAKRRFNALCDVPAIGGNRKTHHHACRQSMSREAGIDEVARRCPSFRAFLDDLRIARG